jgi:uncharacterized protein DUF2834
MNLSRSGKALCALYVALAVVALVATWSFNLQFFALPDNGGLIGFVRGGYANPAAASLSNDLFLLGAACTVFMFTESRRLGIRFVWVYVILSFVVAISVMFPLFMVARQLRLEAEAARP